MKNSTMRFIVLLAAVTLVLGACQKREGEAGGGVTETIAPAAPQPAPTGTEAMTQTVDIESGRSDAEGGVLTANDPNSAPPATTATTATTATAGSPPPATATR